MWEIVMEKGKKESGDQRTESREQRAESSYGSDE
jgi:hypothetical protein